MASTARTLADGLANMIAADGLAAYNLTGIYASSDTGIFMKVIPASPDRAVVITVVPQGDNVTMPLGQVMVQIRTRGLPNDPLDTDDLADSIFALLHGQTNLPMGALTIVQMNRKTSVPMGMDASKRWERVDQFYLDVDYPPTINRPTGGSW